MITKDQTDSSELNKNHIIVLGENLLITELISIVNKEARVTFSEQYKKRVQTSRKLVEKWIEENRVMYGITTGFGALSTTVISKAETQLLQKNILLTHATSVGQPLDEASVRAIMVAMLQNMGRGYSGVRLLLLERIQFFLNQGITPFVPGDGSVGYLTVEGHIGLALIGEGRVYYKNELLTSIDLHKKLEIDPLELAAKEGLALISGTSSPTGIGAIAIHNIRQASLSADVIGALFLEISKGTILAFDSRLMAAKPYKEQSETASNVRRILKDSEMVESNKHHRLQDALSIRALPQLHGAAKRTIESAYNTIQEEVNYCADNPIIWTDESDVEAITISGCLCDSSYVGLELDSASIAATMIAKMSERRNYRLITNTHSDMPWFLIKNPGVNSGLMIPQYTQAGLLNEMRMLSHPSVTDNTPTCGNQEDYVAMGYLSARKALQISEKLEYILAIELLSIYQAQQFIDPSVKLSSVTNALFDKIKQFVPLIEEDQLLHPYIEALKTFIHTGELLKIVEDVIGPLS